MSSLPSSAEALVTAEELDRRLSTTESRISMTEKHLEALIHRSVVSTLFGVFGLNFTLVGVVVIGIELAR